MVDAGEAAIIFVGGKGVAVCVRACVLVGVCVHRLLPSILFAVLSLFDGLPLVTPSRR